MNIIICDDRIDDRKNVSDLLSDYGEKKNYEFTITEYDSGEQLCEEQSALEACQLLFLDINMQGRWWSAIRCPCPNRLGGLNSDRGRSDR